MGDEGKKENEAKEFARVCCHGLIFGYLSGYINLVNVRMWQLNCDVSVIYREILGLFNTIKSFGTVIAPYPYVATQCPISLLLDTHIHKSIFTKHTFLHINLLIGTRILLLLQICKQREESISNKSFGLYNGKKIRI